MKLTEYKARELFVKCGLPSPQGVVIDCLDGLKEKIKDMQYPVVVKAQVQVGGRGKAGGVKFADNSDEAVGICETMLHSDLKGFKVNQILIIHMIEAIQECYISFTLDRLNKVPMLIFSSQGGVDIEETAKANPEKIAKILIDPLVGVKDYTIRYILNKGKLGMEYFDQMSMIVNNLYKVFTNYDCMLAEINPLFVTPEKNLVAGDGKVTIDDSALYRMPDMLAFRDSLPEEELVLEARKHRFLYIPIVEGGDIAVMSNGSGMLMSCIDLISKEEMTVGAALDLGGGATADRIKEAIRIVLSNQNIKTLFVSIFGGITRCDEVAGGVKLAMEAQSSNKTVIVRMEGTNKETGLEIIKGVEGDVVSVNSIREGVSALVERRNAR
jgi:succinyl-CoA synthetase beta subunit